MALVVKAVPFLVGLVLEDVSLLLQTLANEFVRVLEPAAKLRVLIGIAINLVEGVEEIVSARRIGKPFDECLNLCQCCFVVIECTYRRTLRLASADLRESSSWAPFTVPAP